MTSTLIDYTCCCIDKQDLTARIRELTDLRVAPGRISPGRMYMEKSLIGTNCPARSDQAIAAVREGDTLLVPKLRRLAGAWRQLNLQALCLTDLVTVGCSWPHYGVTKIPGGTRPVVSVHSRAQSFLGHLAGDIKKQVGARKAAFSTSSWRWRCHRNHAVQLLGRLEKGPQRISETPSRRVCDEAVRETMAVCEKLRTDD